MSTATVLLISSQSADKARLADALGEIRGQPYRLEVTSTLADALNRIKHGRVDAILLDLSLPDSSGLTTFLRIQPKAPEVPIVVLVENGAEDLERTRLHAARSISCCAITCRRRWSSACSATPPSARTPCWR